MPSAFARLTQRRIEGHCMIGTLVLGTTLCIALLAAKDDPMAACPMHADGSAKHGAEVDGRHDTFGMPHTASTHSFRLFADGGAIELRANNAADQKTITAIRAHLQHVAEQFVGTDFSTPAFVHGYPPDGVAAMTRLHTDISYRYESLPAGGRIRITTKGPEALAAVHDFLRFQVKEHRTANSGTVEEDGSPSRLTLPAAPK